MNLASPSPTASSEPFSRRKREFLEHVEATVDDQAHWRGRGELLAALEPSYGVGVDFSPAAVSRAKAPHPGLNFYVGDAEDDADVTISPNMWRSA